MWADVCFRKKFWDELQVLHKSNTEEDMRNWLIKLHVHLKKQLNKISKDKKKMKKLHKPSGNSVIKDYGSTHFQEHLDIFTFLNDFSVYCDNFSADIVNSANLALFS